jgi:hypothetical protein
MSATARTSSLLGGVVGVLEQLANELLSRVAVQVGPLPDVPVGDVVDVRRGAARDAADAVEVLLDALSGRRDVDPQAARASRPLLASADVQGPPAGSTLRLRVAATAPDADWQAAGREGAMVAVYLDGRYHSTILVNGERDEPYEVNLGPLAPGAHRVELRAATDVAPVAAAVASVQPRVVTGDEALVDRLQPVVAMRDVDSGPRASSARSDAPLLLAAAITANADGTRTIEYRTVFSNEDGGTAAPELLVKYGRTVDAEPVYRVVVDRAGRVLREEYQSPVHRWLEFDGDRVDGRPLIRVSTANNLVSARTGLRPTERWSDAAVAIVAPESSDHELLVAHPWAWSVMAKELLREGRAVVGAADAVRGARQVGDPRRYVFLGPLDDAARAAIAVAGGIELVLADGRRVLAKVAAGFASGDFHQTAVELPPGIDPDAVRGVALLGVSAVVLDAMLRMRRLAAT